MGSHYIPQKYLRGFTDSVCPNALWQFDKKTLSFSKQRVSIAKIAQQRSFYNAETEKSLNELVERPGNSVLEKLRSGNISLAAKEKVHLSVYIATMIKRVPYHRAKGEALVPEVLKKVTSDLRKEICELQDTGKISPPLANKYLADTDNVEAKYESQIPSNVLKQIRSPWPSENIIKAVYEMHWRFVHGQDNEHFLTSDNPAFFFDCYGLGTDNSEFTFPISRKLAIFGSWTPVSRGSGVISRNQFVKEANRRLIDKASRFVYSCDKFEWIRTFAMKEPYLSRIEW